MFLIEKIIDYFCVLYKKIVNPITHYNEVLNLDENPNK